MRRSRLALLLGLALTFGPAAAHEAHHHGHDTAPPVVAAGPSEGQGSLPIEILLDERFALIDQHGKARGPEVFEGRASLVFFGYANCEGVCLTGVPAIAAAATALGAKGHAVRPVLITIDPERDTPAALRRELGPYHQDYLGLTGSVEALAEARRLFKVKATLTHTDRAGGAVFQHGTFVYLIGADGRFRTLFPPVLPPAEMARIVETYL